MQKEFVEINGRKQGMFFQEKNTDNPVLLFLHGGPGSPEAAFEAKYPTGMDALFTVCWWEQRGSAISYSAAIPAEEMTLEQMIADTAAVANYLRGRFHQEKIYVMGHSWGTFLGVLTVQRHPELFHAYMGIGQVARQLESERLAYVYMVQEFRRQGNAKMVRKFKKYAIDKGGDVSFAYLAVRSEGMMKLGIGVMHRLTSMLPCVLLVLRYRGYTFREKVNFARGSSFSLKYLWDDVLATDFTQQVPELKVPVYIFHGKYDYQVSYVIAKEFASKLKAPVKGFYTFEQSAHSPCFEEPEKLCAILREDVLQGKTELADGK